MKHAIALLATHAQACEINAPIHDAQGLADQSALDHLIAAECRAAIEALESIAHFDACLEDIIESAGDFGARDYVITGDQAAS